MMINHDVLDQARTRGDVLVDQTLLALMTDGYTPPFSYQMIKELAQNDQASARALIDHLESTPPWVDWETLERGRKLFVRTHILSTSALLLGGMIESYTNPHIAKVLVYSGQLIQASTRRVFETGQMVYDTHLPHGLYPDAQGFKTLVNIRLLHATIRLHIQKRQASLDETDSLGQDCPINQEDSLFTLFMFNVIVIENLKRLGLTFTQDELESYQHFWSYVGWILGVEEALLPHSYDHALELYRLIKSRHCCYGEDAQKLTHALLKAVENQPPFFLPESALHGLTRFFIGDEAADALKLQPSSRRFDQGLHLSRRPLLFFSMILSRSTLLESLSSQVGRFYGYAVLRIGLKRQPATFHPPPLDS